MNILFKCFKCEKEKKKDIHSYSWNKEKEPFQIQELCKHFSNIELNWITKYGIFTIGWQVKIYDIRKFSRPYRKSIIYLRYGRSTEAKTWWKGIYHVL